MGGLLGGGAKGMLAPALKLLGMGLPPPPVPTPMNPKIYVIFVSDPMLLHFDKLQKK